MCLFLRNKSIKKKKKSPTATMVDKLCVSQASCLKLGVSKAQLKELGYLIT